MAFTAIVQASDLDASGRKQAALAGPREVLVRTSYRSLMRSAGFVDIVAENLTTGYRAVLQHWFAATERRRATVAAEIGDAEADQRRSQRLAAAAAIDEGVLERWLYVARRRG